MLTMLMLGSIGCVRNQPQVIVITATFLPATSESIESGSAIATDIFIAPTETLPTLELSAVPDESLLTQPTENPPRAQVVANITEHTVQAGDTLSAIAEQYGTSLDSLLAVNELANPNILVIGQVIKLPNIPTQETPNFKIIPDSRLIRTSGHKSFNLASFVSQQPGIVRTVSDEVVTRLADGSEFKEILNFAQIVDRVSEEYSVDPRILLAILEYRAQWLSKSNIPDDSQEYALISAEASIGFDRSGIYNQLSWLANELNRGYYSWKYRGNTILELAGGQRLLYASGLNAGTIGIQYVLSLNNSHQQWLHDVSADGLFSIYYGYFGDPFVDNIDSVVPNVLNQPPLTLPFQAGDIWRFTGGFHGGWGSGSAWSALDFAPPDDRQDGDSFCYISQYDILTVAPGVIARNSKGVVVLDLDNDGDESTGWSILYLHITADPTLQTGGQVLLGSKIGNASCHGGVSTATHLHIARRYNGEWIPADCQNCDFGQQIPRFEMSNWSAIGIDGQQYQGYMDNSDGRRIVAEQGRETTINQISW